MPAARKKAPAAKKTAPAKSLRTADKLARLGLGNDMALVLHLPMRYEDETQLHVQVEGVVTDCDVQYRPRRQLVVTLADDSGRLTLRFLNFYGSQATQMAVGRRLRVRGDMRHGFFGDEMVHPAVKPVEEDTPLPDALTPVYPAGEGLSQALLRKAIAIDSAFYGDAHPLSFDSRGNLASTLQLIDDGSGASIAEAIRVFDENRRVGSSLVAPPDEHLLSLMESAMLMAKTAPVDEAAAKPVLADAVKLGEDALRVADQRRIADAARWRDFRKTMGFIYACAGRFADAERVQRHVRDLWIAAGDPTAIPVFNVTADLADSIAAQGRTAEAIDLLQSMQDAKPQRAPTSDARWLNAVMLRDLLRDQVANDPAGPAKARLIQQEAEVATLRKAREAAQLSVELDAPVVPSSPTE